MRYLGLGIEEDYHLWYENERLLTYLELLDNFIDKVIPHEKKIILPTEAPITAPTLPTLKKVVKISRLALDKDHMTVDENS